LDAFSWALHLGATGLESDAWLTADGVVVLDHDGVTGPLWKRRALSSQPRSALPSHIPSLAELYETCGTDFQLSLDVKDPAALAGIVATAEAAGAGAHLWLCYHDWKVMAGWRSSIGPAHLVESTNLAWISEGLPARCAALRAAGINAINMNFRQWTAELVAQTHQAGLASFAWDVQSGPDLERVLDYQVDGMYSDHVGRMMSAIKARSSAT
jgi:glycerophosphoryl diester phosphodiesterase